MIDTKTELLTVVKTARRYPKAHGWSFFYNVDISKFSDAAHYLAMNPNAVQFG